MEDWRGIGDPTPPKDTPMRMTKANFYKIIAMRDELIFEQKAELGKLRNDINKLQQRVAKLSRQIVEYRK